MKTWDKLLQDLPTLEPGWVWLTGAGPGDPGLLSLLACHGLRQADVVIYDALVSPGVLALAGDRAQMIDAGKRGGRPSPTQSDISRRLVELARAGKRVLRLKGGDPLIFGRGGEEALALAAAGVPFRIVPGISAGVGGLAYAGIALTHRSINSAVTFVTGHDVSGSVSGTLDWPALAKGSPVLVIYMALSNLEALAGRLLDAGRRADEPVALVSKATTPDQRIVETTLGSCAQAAVEKSIEPPCMVVLGEVVRLRAGLDWLGAMSGRKLEAGPLD
ncbi:MAG: uroporphyrinogen-III C-methyltransferase [Sphingomonadales bacterium]